MLRAAVMKTSKRETMSIVTHVNSSNQKKYALTTYDKVNSSPTQAKFAFSKAERFPKIKANCAVSTYDIPGALSTRAAGMGFGKQNVFDGKSGKYSSHRQGSFFLLNALPR